MTKARITKNKNAFEVEIESHAGDIRTCAAVSALTYTLYNSLLEYDRNGWLKTFDVEDENDYFHALFEAYPCADRDVDTIMHVIAVGLYALSEEYPDYIVLDCDRENI